MGSKGRGPQPHHWHPGPSMIHPETFGPGIRPPSGGFASFDALPPPEVMEQKLATQHVEIQKLASENQRLAATHGTLRQELAAAQHELQMLHAHIGAMKSEREQQVRNLMDIIAKMESDLQAGESIKVDLQQAQADAQSLVAARQELISKVKQLTDDLQRAHADAQQIPVMITELDGLRQEFQHYRTTYEYEKKLYNDHLESLQVMEKNYVNMAREVEKLRAELTNATNVDRTGGPHGGGAGYNESEAAEHYRDGLNPYGDGYSISQGRVHSGGSGALVAGGGGSTPSQAGGQAGHIPASTGFEASRGSSYEAQRGLGGPGYDTQRGPGGLGYDAHREQAGPGFDPQTALGYNGQRAIHGYEMKRGASFDNQGGPVYPPRRVPAYNAQKPGTYDLNRGPGYDIPKNVGHDASSKGSFGPQEQIAPATNTQYHRSATSPNLGPRDYGMPTRGTTNTGQR